MNLSYMKTATFIKLMKSIGIVDNYKTSNNSTSYLNEIYKFDSYDDKIDLEQTNLNQSRNTTKHDYRSKPNLLAIKNSQRLKSNDKSYEDINQTLDISEEELGKFICILLDEDSLI